MAKLTKYSDQQRGDVLAMLGALQLEFPQHDAVGAQDASTDLRCQENDIILATCLPMSLIAGRKCADSGRRSY